MWSTEPAAQRSAVTAAVGTPHNPRVHVASRQRVGECRCSFRFEHRRASMRTSGTGNGGRLDRPAAPCIPLAAAPFPAMAATLEQRHKGCGSLGGTAGRAAGRSACCQTSSPPGCPACLRRSRRASPSPRRPRAWRPRPMRCAGSTSPCPVPSGGCAVACTRSGWPSGMWWRRRL